MTVQISDEDAALVGRVLDRTLGPEDLIDEMAVLESRLGIGQHYQRFRLFRLRVELLFMLTPRAVHVPDTVRRKQIAQEDLERRHGIPSVVARRLANRLVSMADRLRRGRDGGSVGLIDDLIKRQNGRCHHCHQRLFLSPADLPADPYKPYRWYPSELSAELDHVHPVSLFGDDDPSNCVVLCRFCNRGKSDYSGVSPRQVRDFAARRVESPPDQDHLPYLRAIVYYRIDADHSACTCCGRNDRALTVRPRDGHDVVTIATTHTICVAHCNGSDSCP